MSRLYLKTLTDGTLDEGMEWIWTDEWINTWDGWMDGWMEGSGASNGFDVFLS